MRQPSAEQLSAGGVAALRRGDPVAARLLFEQWIALEAGNSAAFLGLAYACHAQADSAGAAAALEHALRLDPASLQAHALQGDLLMAEGRIGEAANSYRNALRVVAEPDGLPGALRAEHARVTEMLGRIESALASHLQQSVGPPVTARMAHALDLLSGRRRHYPSEPRHFLMPELPTIQFHDRAAFPWLEQLEAATPLIRDELRSVLAEPTGIEPYLQSRPGQPARAGEGLVDDLGWSAFHLWRNGEVVEQNARRCPQTMAALSALPLTRIAGRSPAALFSLLRPGVHIPAHHGFLNARLIVHLPLIVPPGCALRVGNETRAWEEGRAWLFDDTIEHEAWNRGSSIRAILLFEVWRPELTPGECEQIDRLFEVIDRSHGGMDSWGL